MKSKKRMGKITFLGVLLGFVNLHVDSQYLANFIGHVPVVGRFLKDIELESTFFNIPFIHNDVSRVKFFLYTKQNPEIPHNLNLEDEATFARSNWNPAYPVKILIHGYAQAAHSKDFPKSLKDAYLDFTSPDRIDGAFSNSLDSRENGSYNIICLDWSTMSKELIYFSSAFHTEKVGLRVGQFLMFLRDHHYVENFAHVHLIGFSLGSHVAGVAGNFVKTATNGSDTVGRITGLDPAGPGFFTVPARLRLDKGDADFVDVIHSNSGNLFLAQYGTPQPIGHVDFFPNGGGRQPACAASFFREFTIPRRLACNHLKSAEYFGRTIRGDAYVGCYCESWVLYTEGLCNCSSSNSTALMGEYCDPHTRRGRYYLYLGSKGT